ncbi:Glycosyltransferase, catalytic subunit of cellulose synthase and poly-beta-1,6-N-acetylglucosamine synthase [Methylobacterium gossipiicola]|uniref:Glycosyltransferase, catalytic subunit of cellulose synthase and poly-beta-1,6-N-acetylglucosamine synthase n=1 Tax=Methylobacterium gossipiicola TaxID=582675 RepID=A0A1I2RY69_9HYPH|nr:Glycosyltransferase, catalytic subunit of cellulose synthase and poly-beta-1,6-N-acetylglucosamine synthase [Methylobacterium gossipiicola]
MMIFLAAMLLICFLLAVHPYTTYPLSLLALKALRRNAIAPIGAAPNSYAIACCVYNERQVIEAKVANMLALKERLPNCQLLVHSDGSSDGTDEFLRAHSDVLTLSFAERRAGKSTGMNALMRKTSAEVVIFTDANVMIDPERVANVGHYFRDPKIGCVTGHLSYTNPDESATAWTGARYWRFEEWLKQLESETGSVVGADGSIFAIRRRLYTPAPADIIDDFHTSMSIFCSGHRIVRAEDFVAYERAATVREDELRRKVRISCRAFNCHRLLWPRILRSGVLPVYMYTSHKLLRWLSGYFVALGMICTALMVGLAFGPAGFLAFVAALVLGIVLAGRTRLPLVSKIWEGVAATAATGAGVYKSLRGERFQTWTIAASTRR